MKTAEVSFKRRSDKAHVVHVHNGMLPSVGKDEILPFVTTWMDLENFMLSEKH